MCHKGLYITYIICDLYFPIMEDFSYFARFPYSSNASVKCLAQQHDRSDQCELSFDTNGVQPYQYLLALNHFCSMFLKPVTLRKSFVFSYSGSQKEPLLIVKILLFHAKKIAQCSANPHCEEDLIRISPTEDLRDGAAIW